MAKKGELTEAQAKLLLRIRACGSVMRVYDDGEEQWWLPNTGRANRRSVECLIRMGKLVPSGDGFFGNDSQTYRIFAS